MSYYDRDSRYDSEKIVVYCGAALFCVLFWYGVFRFVTWIF